MRRRRVLFRILDVARVENRFTVERIEDEQPGGEIDPRAQFFPFSYAPEELPDIARAMERLYSDPGGDLDRWVRQFVTRGATTQTSHLLMTMTYAIKEGFSYERREAPESRPRSRPWSGAGAPAAILRSS